MHGSVPPATTMGAATPILLPRKQITLSIVNNMYRTQNDLLHPLWELLSFKYLWQAGV